MCNQKKVKIHSVYVNFFIIDLFLGVYVIVTISVVFEMYIVL